jgi:hypothetical protein
MKYLSIFTADERFDFLEEKNSQNAQTQFWRCTVFFIKKTKFKSSSSSGISFQRNHQERSVLNHYEIYSERKYFASLLSI